MSRHEGEPEGLSSTYEGPYAFAYGWFYALTRSLTVRLANCPYAAAFHRDAIEATQEPFFRKEDDPMNGHWLHKCLAATGEVVEPLPTLAPRIAHNMACISNRGLYRRPHNESVIVHFLKNPSSMDFVAGTLQRERLNKGGVPSEINHKCCSRMVWPDSPAAQRTPLSECKGLMK